MRPMDAVVLDGIGGGSLAFGRPQRLGRGSREPWSFEATLRTSMAHATVEVWEDLAGPAAFLRELADAWHGFDGTRSYRSPEGQLTLACRHDGRGTIVCDASLGSSIPPIWRLTAELRFEAGAHLARLADELEALHHGTAHRP